MPVTSAITSVIMDELSVLLVLAKPFPYGLNPISSGWCEDVVQLPDSIVHQLFPLYQSVFISMQLYYNVAQNKTIKFYVLIWEKRL